MISAFVATSRESESMNTSSTRPTGPACGIGTGGASHDDDSPTRAVDATAKTPKAKTNPRKANLLSIYLVFATAVPGPIARKMPEARVLTGSRDEQFAGGIHS